MTKLENKPNTRLDLSELIAMGVGGMIGGGIFSVMGPVRGEIG